MSAKAPLYGFARCHPRLSRTSLRERPRRSGQAMVEFVVALFAIVLIVAGIADFIDIASCRSELFATLRGQAGAAAIAASGTDDASARITGGAEPLDPPQEARLAQNFQGEKKKEEVPLSDALRDWLFQGSRDSVTVGDSVWMPPLEVEVGEP